MVLSLQKELVSLLKENYVHELFFTHVSLIQPFGKYSLSRSVLTKFWNLYCKIIQTHPSDVHLGLAETPQNFTAVVVDVDLKYVFQDETRLQFYNLEFVRALIHIYQDVLREVLGNPSANYTCVFLEKPYYTIMDNDVYLYKKGFHLHFPHIFINRVDHEIIVIPKVREYVTNNHHGILDAYEQFSNSVINIKNPSQFIDIAVTKNSWLLYGSKKSETQEPYTISKIFSGSLEELSLYDAFSTYELFDEEEEPLCLNTEEAIEFYLPRILSILPYGRKISTLKPGVQVTQSLMKFVSKPNPDLIKDERNESTFEKDLEQTRKLIRLLNPARADERNDWMTTGWTIFNISRGSDEGLELWLQFSKQSAKYNENQCIYEWSHMENRKKMSIGTLKYFVKLDNPDGYQNFLQEEHRSHMKKELQTTHYDLAMILHEKYGHEYVYSEMGWYAFQSHHWEFIGKGLELRAKISTDLVDFFITLRVNLFSDMGSTSEESELDRIKKKESNITKLISQLKTSAFKCNIMRECEEIFHVRDFEKKLNTNRYLIGFQNGVYDLEKNHFRDGLPSDWISLQMSISYREFSNNDPRVLTVNDFFEKVFPDHSLRRYFLDIMSETFVGFNHRKEGYFWTGEGDNGKSITQMFFEKMFGRLSIKAPTTLITSKRQGSGSANAELARADNGVRTMFLEEPDPDEEVHIGIFKHLTGNDSIYNRDLYQTGRSVSEIIPMFKMFVICNKLPKIRKGGDKATWNRIRVIPFEATFSKNAPASVEEQVRDKIFPVDPNLAQKIPGLVEPLAWMLLQHRLQPKIAEPEKVKAATDRYRMINDYLHQFANQVVVDDPKGQVTPNELYYRYKDWISEGLPGEKAPPLLDFTEYFQKRWGDLSDRGYWIGKRIRVGKGMLSIEEENEDDDMGNGDGIMVDVNELLSS